MRHATLDQSCTENQWQQDLWSDEFKWFGLNAHQLLQRKTGQRHNSECLHTSVKKQWRLCQCLALHFSHWCWWKYEHINKITVGFRSTMQYRLESLWFVEKHTDGIPSVVDWSPQSPDWNIVDAVWDHLVGRQKAETSKEEFECLSRSLRTIPENHLRKTA